MPRFEREPSEFVEKVVSLNRVSKTVKGGRVMKFSALVVVGDEKGKVGFGLGKAAEVPEAIRKGLEAAKKNMFTITLSGTTIPHEVVGEFRVLMKPAAPVAGARLPAVRIRCAVLEAAGIKDTRTSSAWCSTTPPERASATMEGCPKSPVPRLWARIRVRAWKRSWATGFRTMATWKIKPPQPQRPD